MKSALFLLAFAVLLPSSVFSQIRLIGVVTDKNENTIPFVNIGIKGKSVGTVSDVNGKFTLDISQKFISDSLTFSSIGYKSKTSAISGFPLDYTTIVLEQEMYSLPEVVVRDVALVKKMIGNTKSKTSRSLEFGNNEFGNELGAFIQVKKPSRLLSFHANLNRCTYDSLFFRLNVYKVVGPEIFTSVLSENIFLNVKSNERMTEIEFDLRPYEIFVENDILISLEQVSELGEGRLQFALQRQGSSWVRAVSLADWFESPYGGVGFYLWVETEK